MQAYLACITRADGQSDIYPTLLDLCGLAQQAGLEGNNLMPLLENMPPLGLIENI